MKNTMWVAAVLLFAVALAVGCDKLNIPGNLAGQVLNEAGQGQGYISVAVVNVDTGVEVMRLTAEDGGNFFFEKLDAGTYEIKTYSMAGAELPNDSKPVKLGTGRTESVIVYLVPAEQQPE